MNADRKEWFKVFYKDLFQADLFPVLGAGFLITLFWSFLSDPLNIISNAEDLDWIQYYSLITLLPLSAVMISLIRNETGWNIIRVFLTVFFFISVSLLYWSTGTFILSFCSSLIFIFFLRKAGYLKEDTLFPLLCFNSIFLIVSRISWWQDAGSYTLTHPYALGIYFLILILSLLCFFREDVGRIFQEGRLVRILKVIIPPGIFFVMAIACKQMSPMQIHHWGCYTGTAELIRQGGYLLWSVPSQYGFLSILSIAFFPGLDCWEAFWIIQLIFLTGSAMMLFYILYSYSHTWFNYFLSLLTSICAVFLFPGWVPDLSGVNLFPSVGPFRFFWVYTIVFFIVIQRQRRFIKSQKHENYIGSLIWLIACLWSFESAYYVSFVWFTYLLFQPFTQGQLRSRKEIIADLTKKLMIPVLFFFVVLIIICSFYLTRISVMPDFYSYAEHALSFKGGFGSFSISLGGGFGFLLLVLVLIVTDILYLFKLSADSRIIIPFIAALYAGCWAFISYFVGRSHENNISNLIPLVILTIGSLLLIRRSVGTPLIFMKLTGSILYTMVIVLTLGNRDGIMNFRSMIRLQNLDVKTTLPAPDPDILKAMSAAGITAKDSIVYIDYTMLLGDRSKEGFFYWLPVNPATTYDPLKADRTKLYLQRFSARSGSGGYLITRTGSSFYLKLETAVKSCFDPAGPAFLYKDICIQRYKVGRRTM